MTRTLTITFVVVAPAVAIAGCQDPYTSDRTRLAPTPTNSPRAATGDSDRPEPSAGSLPLAAKPSPSARRAARSFATRWVNWHWRSAASQQRALARLATGDLARQLRANASSARIDASLARDKPGSRGTVAAIELRASEARAAGLVVTREQTYTDGRADLGGQHHHVYRIRLIRDSNGWGVSAWKPQP
jgi:hypothetical protein